MQWLWLWMVGVGLIIVVVSVVGEDVDIRCKEEKEKHFDSPIPKPTADDLTGSTKHKRCSYNLKNPNMKASERKEQAEKRRLELLCKFCNKSETRMNKIPLCKKCISDIPDPTDNPILKAAKQNIIKKSTNMNSLEGKTENIPRWSLTDRLAHLDALTTNQNVRESIMKLITPPLTSTRNMLHVPQTTKETMKSDKQLNTDWRGDKTIDTNILGNYPTLENRRNIPQVIHLPQETMKNDKELNTDWGRGKTIDRNILERYPTLDSTSNIFQTLHLPQTSKETMKNDKLSANNWGTKTNDANILGSYPSKIPATYNTESVNLNQITRDFPVHSSSFHHDKEISPTNEIIRAKRLKDIRNLKHEDFVKILKDALHSKENLRSTEIRKRDSILTEDKEKFKQALIHVLPHQTGVEIDYEEYDTNSNSSAEDAWYDEYIKSFGKMVTNTLNEETSTSSTTYTKEEMKTTEISTSSEMNTELTNNTEINFDDIVEQTSPNIVEDFSQINKESTTGNSLETTTETVVSKDLNINTISPKPTNITKIETKKPSHIRQAIENLRNKHTILKNSLHTMKKHKDPNNISTLKLDLSSTNEPTSNEDNCLTNPTQNTEHETKIISTRSTRDVTIQEKDPTTPKDTNSDDVKIEFLEKQNMHGIIKKVLPTTFTNPNLQSPLLNPDGKDAIFKNHLNMDPNINTNKYKDLALSMKNNVRQNENRNSNPNDILTLHNCENDLRNPIHKDKNIYLTENRINLPLILKQKEDGTIQLLLDKSICDYCLQSEAEKYVFKRKTDDNLSKYPLNIFNILDKHNDHSSKNINNYLQMFNKQNINEELIKEQFYKYLIDEQLYKLFATLDIPVESSAEMHSYVDDLSDNEKNKLKNYLLTSISNNYSSKDGNKINEELYNQKQTEFLQSILHENTESTTESNRITLQIKSEDDLHPQPNLLKIEDDNILRSFIRDQILNEIKNTNLCPVCEKQQCMCSSNDPANYPRDNYYDEGRIIDKRHYIHPPVGNILTDQDDLAQKKYKIVNNFLNWARDVVVPHKKL